MSRQTPTQTPEVVEHNSPSPDHAPTVTIAPPLQPNPQLPVPKNQNVESPEPLRTKKVPTEIRRQRTFNKEVLKEGIKTKEEGGRRTRNSKKLIDNNELGGDVPL